MPIDSSYTEILGLLCSKGRFSKVVGRFAARGESAVEQLSPLLNDSDPVVVVLASAVLCELSKQCFSAARGTCLLGMLGHPNPLVRKKSMETFVKVGEPALLFALKALERQELCYCDLREVMALFQIRMRKLLCNGVRTFAPAHTRAAIALRQPAGN